MEGMLMLGEPERDLFHAMRNAFQVLVAWVANLATALGLPFPAEVEEATKKFNDAGRGLYHAPRTTKDSKTIVVIQNLTVNIECDELCGAKPGEVYVRIRNCDQCSEPFAVLVAKYEERANTQRFCRSRGDACRLEFRDQRRKEEEANV